MNIRFKWRSLSKDKFMTGFGSLDVSKKNNNNTDNQK